MARGGSLLRPLAIAQNLAIARTTPKASPALNLIVDVIVDQNGS
jgi:hypothetical protein